MEQDQWAGMASHSGTAALAAQAPARVSAMLLPTLALPAYPSDRQDARTDGVAFFGREFTIPWDFMVVRGNRSAGGRCRTHLHAPLAISVHASNDSRRQPQPPPP